MDAGRRTKIVCTLGPACDNVDILQRMIVAGMDVARLNFSHGTHETHGRLISAVREAARRTGKRIGIMLDTRGPEVRLGFFSGGRAHLETGSDFTLVEERVTGDSSRAQVDLPGFADAMWPGAKILIDDGNIMLEVTRASGGVVATKVINGGVVSDKKKVAVPGADIVMPIAGERDASDLRFGAQMGVDFVAASFIRSAEDVAEIRRILSSAGSKARIISKIECVRGVDNLDAIIEASDGLMVARGDLGVEFPPEDIPILQKRMIAGCMRVGKPVITATQMLESMIEHPRPTRAEASDVANAIFDGTDAVMLSAETASGKYPLQSVEVMAKIAARTDRDLDRGVFLPRFQGDAKVSSVTEAVSRAVIDAADDLRASAIVTPTESGYTARMVARFRPSMPVYATTPHDHTAGWLSVVWGVATIITGVGKQDVQPGIRTSAVGAVTGSTSGTASSDAARKGDVSEVALRSLQAAGLVKPGDLCVITKGVPAGISGTTNVMEIRTANLPPIPQLTD